MIVNKPKKRKKEISRYTIMKAIMGGVFTVLAVKTLYLQVYKHDYYVDRAKTNSIRFVDEKTPRGEILDNEGNVLAGNKQIYILKYSTPTEGKYNFYETMGLVFEILEENEEVLLNDTILKLNENGEPYYEFKSSDTESQDYDKIRFLKDRGMNDYFKRKLFSNQNVDLDEKQSQEIDEKLKEVTAKEAFNYLIKTYDLIDIIDSKPVKKSGTLTKEDKQAYDTELSAYNERKKIYKDMTGDEILAKIEGKYSREDLYKYFIVKDALRIQSFKNDKSIVIANNIKTETAFTIYQRLNDLPGVDVDKQPVREYPYGTLGSAVLGYVSKIDSSTQASYELRGYDASTDLIGKAGIEASYENDLKGTKGGKTVKVNSQGRETEELFRLESSPGNTVHLNINKDVQYAMQQALEDTIKNIQQNKRDNSGHTFGNATRGFAMVAEVNTGKILGMASYPDYDPNKFAIPGQLSQEEIQQYFAPDLEAYGKKIVQMPGVSKSIDELFPKDKNGNREDKYDLYPKPFYNYATLGTLPPGSIFKPLTVMAGLQEGVITPSEQIMAGGVFTGRPSDFGTPACWIHANGGSHGLTNAAKALEVSCNVYMYETAYRLYTKTMNENKDLPEVEAKQKALNSLANWAWKFGLGSDPNSQENPSTGIEIEENTTGQTYNFTTNKKNIISFAKFELNDYLANGTYAGGESYVPFDFAANLADTPELEQAKINLKKKITDRLEVVGTGDKGTEYEAFYELVLPDVKKIMEISPKYTENINTYNASGRNTNIDEQAKKVASVIGRFTIHDKPVNIMSPTEIISASIGQGINQFTPLQLMSYITTLANGGTRYSLNLVDKVTSVDGTILKQNDPTILSETKIDKGNLDAVKEGMRRANDGEQGTAASVFKTFPISTAGKTGTADYHNDQRSFGRSPYATYVSFSPIDKPEIAFVGGIYDGGHGSYTAPVAKAAYEAYYKETLEKDYPNYVANSDTFKKYVLNAPKDNNESQDNDDSKNNKEETENKEN
ncbi:penicillin-binding transpeptidase domain-containing protein [uncultured Clostridium sp.]|uniref:penicillin-binding transpeptidase domain-containing protein n=1 Tax=uncultured Clostridium sp. TaxID=59620 RepID=UPI002616CF4A|nr:penicillin-binding transpeptidase domain-containing protein [uncultured Clostridium sp.]